MLIIGITIGIVGVCAFLFWLWMILTVIDYWWDCHKRKIK
jgi:hypothetical protein